MADGTSCCLPVSGLTSSHALARSELLHSVGHWGAAGRREVLLELVVKGNIVRRKREAATCDELEGLRWARPTARRDVLWLDDKARLSATMALDRAWPSWRSIAWLLSLHQLPATAAGLRELQKIRAVNDTAPQRDDPTSPQERNAAEGTEMTFVIASYKRREREVVQWWLPDGKGYTPKLAEAGRYPGSTILNDRTTYAGGNCVVVPTYLAERVALSERGEVKSTEATWSHLKSIALDLGA